jgi:hypothetical protein
VQSPLSPCFAYDCNPEKRGGKIDFVFISCLPFSEHQHLDVDFAFITLIPDDVGALKGERLKERGRQNVILNGGNS